jgi:hypothetical protein
MANNKFYRDFYSLPYDGRPTPDVFNSGILVDNYPGIQGALQNQIGSLDRYLLISGFETTLASTTASINSGYAYINGSMRFVSAGDVTSVTNNDVIGLTKDGFKRMNAAALGDYSKFTGIVFAITNNDTVLREIHDGIQSSGLTEEYVGITKNTKNVAKKTEYFGEHTFDHSGAVGGALNGAFLFKDHGVTLWRSMQGKIDFQVPIYFGGDSLTNSTNITYDAGFIKTNTGYSAPTGKFDIVDAGVGYIDICSGLTGQFGNTTGYYTAANTGQFGNVTGNIAKYATANITTANITKTVVQNVAIEPTIASNTYRGTTMQFSSTDRVMGELCTIKSDGSMGLAHATPAADDVPCSCIWVSHDTYLLNGIITSDRFPAMTPGETMYLGSSLGTVEHEGEITNTLPTSNGSWVQIVGIAIGTQTLLFNPQLVMVQIIA